MNKILNIGKISFLKEYEKVYRFSLSIYDSLKKEGFYIPCVVFKSEYTPQLKDKDKVFVIGKLTENRFTKDDGEEVVRLEIVAEKVERINNSSTASSKKEAQSDKDYKKNHNYPKTDVSEDEIPF
ncbi:single-stranded DNA-binding protein [Helicobacter sp. MIT 05-5294]|uniref:single-stranded DNA-binding protein n=1 Tax=Helicobacter sp. MIT 05-5294 TaxID=1548150 RepID=UPI00051FBC9E|nr:single-stranded DNA-binding protein [Helicobacter sp. MIT 05-5294]TLD85785.1 hypothetical protein LS69_007775 [Helicobacter sp. MIT 05-5294]